MAEDHFDHGGSSRWSSPRNLFSSSPCSSATNETGSFGLNMDVKTTRSRDNSASSVSDGSPTVLGDAQKFQQQPTADDWNQDLHHDTGRSEENYSQIVQASGALNSSMNYRHQTRGVDDCNEIDNKINFCGDHFSVNAFKRESQISFTLQQQPLASITECTETCQGLSTHFPLDSASYGYTSTSLRTLFDTDYDHSQQALFDNQEMSYLSATKFSNELMSGFSKVSPLQIRPYVAKQQPAHRLQFSNNTPFWNATAPPDFISSTLSKDLTSGLNNFPSTNHDQKRGKEESKNLASVAKTSSSNEPALKHPRLKTPSPLPTFKVRKEKLGDRITALQQLVSPFGKADTASVLHESIEYIKFLHDQVDVLSTPYLKNGFSPFQHQQDQEGLKQDLSSRGLCLVQISSTFPVTAENTSDFWTPTFGRSSRKLDKDEILGKWKPSCWACKNSGKVERRKREGN